MSKLIRTQLGLGEKRGKDGNEGTEGKGGDWGRGKLTPPFQSKIYYNKTLQGKHVMLYYVFLYIIFVCVFRVFCCCSSFIRAY